MRTSVLKINLSDDLIEKIEKYKIIRHKQSIEDTVIDLINYALNLPQHFVDFDWQKAEDEADYEISSDNIKSFDSIENFIDDLNK